MKEMVDKMEQELGPQHTEVARTKLAMIELMDNLGQGELAAQLFTSSKKLHQPSNIWANINLLLNWQILSIRQEFRWDLRSALPSSSTWKHLLAHLSTQFSSAGVSELSFL